MCRSTLGLALGVVLISLVGECYGGLEYGYYDKKCTKTTFYFFFFPKTTVVNVEDIVAEEVTKAYQKDTTIVAALLRLQFHDCFVKGCDASILLDGENSEKTAVPNRSVRGYDLIEAIKQRLENECAGVVSCADIIALATRDAVFLASRQQLKYKVATGRWDGKVSLASNVDLPPPTISVTDSIAAFARKGLDRNDMIYLLGGHTVGVTHCALFQNRVYNFNNTGLPDPTMNSTLVEQLKKVCPQGSSSGTNSAVALDLGTPSTVDNSYYKQVASRRGILQIDQDIAFDGQTKGTVMLLAANYTQFYKGFGEAMVKLGAVGVKSYPEGEIRKTCSTVKSLF
ncbi:hypothetical protein UlMin_000215 [Ulmus minor]